MPRHLQKYSHFLLSLHTLLRCIWQFHYETAVSTTKKQLIAFFRLPQAFFVPAKMNDMPHAFSQSLSSACQRKKATMLQVRRAGLYLA